MLSGHYSLYIDLELTLIIYNEEGSHYCWSVNYYHDPPLTDLVETHLEHSNLHSSIHLEFSWSSLQP